MASVKVKFRPSTIAGKEGSIYYQIIQSRVIRRRITGYLRMNGTKLEAVSLSVVRNEAICSFPCRNVWNGT